MNNRIGPDVLASAYVRAKLRVLASGFGPEIIWQKSLRIEELTEADFLRECAWVILSSGMRESVVRQKFSGVSEAFLGWASARQIVWRRDHCVRSALLCFRHKPKIEAIAQSASIIHEKGFGAVRKEIDRDPIAALRQFPYIGPTTSFHMAKNIGLSVAKSDRHMCRLATLSGYDHATDLCNTIAEYVGDPISVVDIVLWRFATLHRDYLTAFLPGGRGDGTWLT